MKLPESIKERLLTGLISAITGAIGWTLLAIYHEAIDPFLQKVLPAINNKTLLLLSLLLLLVCVTLGIALALEILGNSVERLKKRYPSDVKTGLRKNPKTGDWICPNCFDKGEITVMEMRECGDHSHAQCNQYLCGYSHKF